MGWHHRPADPVVLHYRQVHGRRWSAYHGARGVVAIRARPRRKDGRSAPLNFLVQLDTGQVLVVPGGNLKGLT